MPFNTPVYSIVFYAGLILSIITAATIWKRRPAPGALPFALFILAEIVWTFFWILEISSVNLADKIIWAKIEYFGITSVNVLWLFFTLDFTGFKWWRKGLFPVLIGIIPLITLLLVLTNDWHHLYWSQVYVTANPVFGSVTIWEKGFWFSIFAPYSYLLTAIGVFILWRYGNRKSALQRKQLIFLSISAMLPLAVNLVYLFRIDALVGIDLTPVSLAVASAVFLFTVFRYHFLDVRTIARTTLVENVPDGILVTNAENNVIDMNPSAEIMLGIKKSDLIGKSLNTTLPELDRYRAAMLSGQHCELEPGKICDAYDLDISLTDIYDRSRKLAGQMIILRDITELKGAEERLRQNEKKYRLLIENQSDLLVEVNTQGAYTYVNPAFCKLVGKTSVQLVGGSILDQIYAEDSKNTAKILEDLQINREGVTENRVSTIKGWRWMAWTMNTVQNSRGEVTTISCSGRDITESKLAKEELEKANAQLREVDRMKDNLLSTVSHELRTPLTSIKSFTEILLTYDEDKTTQKEFLGIISSESDRLTRLINDFLDLSKIQAGKMVWNTVELSVSDAIHPAAVTARPLIQNAKLELAVEVEPDLPKVMCDRDKLVQVVTNLLGNAVKFTHEGGKITIKAYRDQEPNTTGCQWVVVSVTDTGIGIAPENHHKIFENFGQVGDVLKDRPKGTGLGLPICKKIVENYGGKIWVESGLGKGTTILFRLPAAAGKSGRSPAAAAPEKTVAETSGKKILVVDDEPNIRRFIQHELTIRGHQVIEATGGKEALDMARKHHPDLITLDIMMPDLNGLDVTAVLKNNPDTKKIPILIISVFEDRQKAFQLGVNDYLTKPISIDGLMKRVNFLIVNSQKNILVADDDENLTRSLSYELEKRGFIVQTAHSGKQVLAALTQNRPDLMLLDINMPEMNGYEVMKAVKDNPETAGIPIVMLTGIEIDGERVKALATGAAEIFHKSGENSKLFETIEYIISSNGRPEIKTDVFPGQPSVSPNNTPASGLPVSDKVAAGDKNT